jgi:hypothetical protein
MNIIEIQDSLKDLPDSALMQEMQAPTGSAPQFLVLSELKRRKRMRDDFQRRQNADMKTVAEEVVTAAGAPQEGIMQVSRAMNPNSSIAQNTGMDMAAPVQPTQAPQMMADGGVVKMQQGGIPMYTPFAAEALQARPGAMTGGAATAIAMLRENYPELYDQYKDSPDLEQVAAAAMSGMAAETPELTGLEQLEAPRDYDLLQSLFTDPSNRAVTRQALETEAMQPELNAAAEAQRAAALATGAYDEDYQPESVRSELESGAEVDPRRIVEAQVTKSPIDEFVYGGQPQYMKRLNPRDTEGYVQGRGMRVNLPDSSVDYDRTGSEQSFVLQRPEGAPISRPSPAGGDMPLGLDTSTFTQPIDVRTPIGDVYADPEKIRATEDEMMAGIGSLGGPLTVSEAAVETATQRRDAPISTQIEQPMLVDQMATASIPDDRSMEEEIRDQRERARMAEEKRMDYLGPIVSDDTISSSLVDLGEAGIEGIGSAFEAGTEGLQSLIEGGDEAAVAEQITEASAIPEGFRLGDGTTAEGALSFGDLLPKDTDTSTTPAGRKSTSTSGGTGGGVGGRIAQMLADREKSAEADKWMALAQTGMALMASKQPTLGGALGEAGLIGVGAMQKSRQQYDKDILDLLTLQERTRRTGSKGGLTAGNMITHVRNLRDYKGDLYKEIGTLNERYDISEEQKAAELERLQRELMRVDFELGTYSNALSGGSTGGQSFDVSGGSQSQGGVGLSLGTPTS